MCCGYFGRGRHLEAVWRPRVWLCNETRCWGLWWECPMHGKRWKSGGLMGEGACGGWKCGFAEPVGVALATVIDEGTVGIVSCGTSGAPDPDLRANCWVKVRGYSFFWRSGIQVSALQIDAGDGERVKNGSETKVWGLKHPCWSSFRQV